MLHTTTPKIALNELILNRFFDSKESFYRSTLKKLTQARAFTFKEISSFGAEIHLIFESHNGPLGDFEVIETEQFSKKKIRWSDLVHFFYGKKCWDDDFKRSFKEEISKHALLVIEESGNAD
jgi:hypothetical protein